ncbi:MAG TPA: MFS transporter [Candidatus Xenobia bacterium]|nr:MFS transporter [Candidatus Xenobia bacterium]
MGAGAIGWLRQASPAERLTLLAGGLGWLLDAFDVMLYSMVLAELTAHFGMEKDTAGLLGSLTLLASALGGFLFGFIADRIGRRGALMASILVYSLASGACGLAQSIFELGLFRFLLGLGMGGEWTTGATLVAETWRAEHRGKALALMQSSWAIGEGLAALVAGALLGLGTLHVLGMELPAWRAVFFAGVLPALAVLWVRRRVPESELWQRHRQSGDRAVHVPLALVWQPGLRGKVTIATLMNSAAMIGYWGLFFWIPPFLALDVAEGGRGLTVTQTTLWLVVMGVGKWFGYTLFGYGADAFGRLRTYIAYLLVAAVLVPVFASLTSPTALLLLGPLVAFFGTGYFSGYGAIASEMLPTEIRGSVMGASYNLGRGVSAAAPFVIGALAVKYGLSAAFWLTSAAFLVAALLACLLPETKGTELK